jgi:tetratricopeptide (TPR) repeat protein
MKKTTAKRFALAALCLLLAVSTAACALLPSPAPMKIADAYIRGFTKFYEQGGEYTKLGLQLQAEYAYGWAGASASAMRYCVDCLLYMKGEGKSLDEVVGGRPGDWDKIASMNYASPYPYYFEGLVYNAESKNDYAQRCYENALKNPAFSADNGEALVVLEVMSINELKAVKKKLTAFEDKLYGIYQPEKTTIPRGEFNFSDAYLRTMAKELLTANSEDYRGALRYYEAALAVNPFEGDNFVGCALMNLSLDDMAKTCYYVNEGLFVDPKHEGLARLAGILNGEDAS